MKPASKLAKDLINTLSLRGKVLVLLPEIEERLLLALNILPLMVRLCFRGFL
jgi:hypothetical protein